MSTFSVGDTVRIKENLEEVDRKASKVVKTTELDWDGDMISLSGQLATIVEVRENCDRGADGCVYFIDADDHRYRWIDLYFEYTFDVDYGSIASVDDIGEILGF